MAHYSPRFDDFTITHLGVDITQNTDYYPFGSYMSHWQKPDENYRFGYQGEFAEEDDETGWNQFEARMYDAMIGRWLSVDPARQFASPYLGMGNDPLNGIDPDGRDWFRDPDTGEPVWLGATATFTDNGGVTWEHISSSTDLIVATHNRDYNDVIGAEPINSALFEVYDATVDLLNPVGSIYGNTVPAGQISGEVSLTFWNPEKTRVREFNTIAEGIYRTIQMPRASKPPDDPSLYLVGSIPTTHYSPRREATGVFLHWGNPNGGTLTSRSGVGPQYSEACLTTGCGVGARTNHQVFYDTYLKNFDGHLWLRGR
ncbi:MAG: RHS repeat-associated core domain-containing protein [Cyclobacteriaceae bacterium]